MLPGRNCTELRPLKHKRYPRRADFRGDFVTLVAGFHYNEGVLLCSDSEVNIFTEPAIKADALKIDHFQGDWGMAAFAASGNLVLAAHAFYACKKALLQAPKKTDALSEIEKILKNEYEENVWDNPAADSDVSLPYDLLVAFCKKGQRPSLHFTQENTLNPIGTYHPLGSGRDSCHSTVRQVYAPSMSEHSVLSLATYALAKAKQDAGGVGGHCTFITMRHNAKYRRLHRDPYLTALESHALWLDLRMKQLFTIYSNPSVGVEQFKTEMVAFNADILTYRKLIESKQSIPGESTHEKQSPLPSPG